MMCADPVLCVFTFVFIIDRTEHEKNRLLTSHHVLWNLLHLGRWSSRSQVELVDEEAGKAVLPHQLHRLLKVLVCFTWQTTDDVCGNSDARNPTGDRHNRQCDDEINTRSVT